MVPALMEPIISSEKKKKKASVMSVSYDKGMQSLL